MSFKAYALDGPDEDGTEVIIEVPQRLGERLYEELLDNYFQLTRKDATNLRDALDKALR